MLENALIMDWMVLNGPKYTVSVARSMVLQSIIVNASAGFTDWMYFQWICLPVL